MIRTLEDLDGTPGIDMKIGNDLLHFIAANAMPFFKNYKSLNLKSVLIPTSNWIFISLDKFVAPLTNLI